jgi:hypothetical protein
MSAPAADTELLRLPVTGFPFNVQTDPMYNGSTMCFLGTALWYADRLAGCLFLAQPNLGTDGAPLPTGTVGRLASSSLPSSSLSTRSPWPTKGKSLLLSL